jgi:transposase InsO family protein
VENEYQELLLHGQEPTWDQEPREEVDRNHPVRGTASPTGARLDGNGAASSTTASRAEPRGLGLAGQAEDRLGIERLLKNPQRFLSEMEAALKARGLGKIGPHAAIANTITLMESTLKAWRITPFAGVFLISGLVDDCLREGVDAALESEADHGLSDQWSAVCKYLESRIYTVPLRRELEDHRPRQGQQSLRAYLDTETRWLRERFAAQGLEFITGNGSTAQAYTRPRAVDPQGMEAAQLDLVHGLANLRLASLIEERILGNRERGGNYSWNELIILIEEMSGRLGSTPKESFSVFTESKSTTGSNPPGLPRATPSSTPHHKGRAPPTGRVIGSRPHDGCVVHRTTMHSNEECKAQKQLEHRPDRSGDRRVDSRATSTPSSRPAGATSATGSGTSPTTTNQTKDKICYRCGAPNWDKSHRCARNVQMLTTTLMVNGVEEPNRVMQELRVSTHGDDPHEALCVGQLDCAADISVISMDTVDSLGLVPDKTRLQAIRGVGGDLSVPVVSVAVSDGCEHIQLDAVVMDRIPSGADMLIGHKDMERLGYRVVQVSREVTRFTRNRKGFTLADGQPAPRSTSSSSSSRSSSAATSPSASPPGSPRQVRSVAASAVVQGPEPAKGTALTATVTDPLEPIKVEAVTADSSGDLHTTGVVSDDDTFEWVRLKSGLEVKVGKDFLQMPVKETGISRQELLDRLDQLLVANQSLPLYNRNRTPIVIDVLPEVKENKDLCWLPAYRPHACDARVLDEWITNRIRDEVISEWTPPIDKGHQRPPFPSVRLPVFVANHKRVVVNFAPANHVVDPSGYINNDPDLLNTIIRDRARADLSINLDLKSGYDQFPISGLEGLQIYLAIKGKTYKLNSLPQGLAISPTVFNSLMQRYFQSIKEVIVYFDDLFIALFKHDDYFDLTEVADLLERVFAVLNGTTNPETACKLNISKCVWFASEVVSGGMLVGQGKIKIDPEKLVEVKNLQMPTTGTELRTILGFFNYFNSSVPGLGAALGVAHKLSSHKGKLNTIGDPDRIDQVHEAIARAQELVLAAPPVHACRPGWDLVLCTDASKLGVCGALFQRPPDAPDIDPGDPFRGTELIAVASRPMTSTESRYSAFMLEVAAGVFATRRFEHWLRGPKQYTWLTDHRTLIGAFAQATPSAHLHRIWEYLSSFNWRTLHVPGAALGLVDAASRVYFRPDDTHGEDLDRSAADLALPGSLIMRGVTFNPAGSAIVATVTTRGGGRGKGGSGGASTTAAGATGLAVASSNSSSSNTSSSSSSSSTSVPSSAKAKEPKAGAKGSRVGEHVEPSGSSSSGDEEGMNWAQGLVITKDGFNEPNRQRNAVVDWPPEYTSTGEPIPPVAGAIQPRWHPGEPLRRVPEPLARGILYQLHLNGHMGSKKLERGFRALGWDTLNLRALCEDVTQSCLPCARYNVGRHGYVPTARSVYDEVQVGDHVALDFAAMPTSWTGFKVLLVVVDVASRFVSAFPLKDSTADTTAKTLVTHFLQVGFPAVISSDNGPSFVADIISRLLEVLRVEQRLSTPYHPQGNGHAEKAVGRVKGQLHKLCDGDFMQWEDLVQAATYALNTSYVESIGTTPFHLFFARKPRALTEYKDIDVPTLGEDKDLQRIAARLGEAKSIIDVVQPAQALRQQEHAEHRLRVGAAKTSVRAKMGDRVMYVDRTRSSKDMPRYLGPAVVFRAYPNGTVTLLDNDSKLLPSTYQQTELKRIRSNGQMDEGGFEVEAILADRQDDYGKEYLVQWKGYEEPKDHEWLRPEAFFDRQIIKRYEEAKRTGATSSSSSSATGKTKGSRRRV